MSLDKEAVRLAYLSKANKRADERMLNVSEAEAQEGTKYAGSGFGRRGLSTQMPRSRKARKFLTKGRDEVLERMPDILDKIPGVPKAVKMGAKALRFAKRAVKGRGKTGGSHKNRYDVEEDVDITTSGERLKRVKGKGMKRAVGGARRGRRARRSRSPSPIGEDLPPGVYHRPPPISMPPPSSMPPPPPPPPPTESVRELAERLMREEGRINVVFDEDGKMRVVGRTGTKYAGKGKTGGAKKKAKKSAEEMGKMYGEEIVARDDDVKELVGSGFFEDFGRGFMKGLRAVSGVAKSVLPIVAPGVGSLASAGLSAVGLGKAENEREYSGGAGLPDDLAYTEAFEMDRTRSGGAMTGGGIMDVFKTASAVVKFLGGLSPKTRGKLASGEHLTSRERSALFKKLSGKGVMNPTMDDVRDMMEMVAKMSPSSRKKTLDMVVKGIKGGGKKRQQSEKMKKRNALVSKLMKEEGMSLPQASKYIKEHNLL